MIQRWLLLVVLSLFVVTLVSCGTPLSPATEAYLKGLRAEKGEEGNTDPLTCFNEAIALDPNQPEFYRTRSYYYSGTGNFKSAEQDLNKGISLSPDWYYLYYDRALYRCRLHKFSSALSDVQIAIKGQPSNYQFYSGLALVHLAMGKPEEALEVLDKALKTKQPSSQWQYQKGIVLGRLGRRDDAIAQFSRTLAITIAGTGNEHREIYFDGNREYAITSKWSDEELQAAWAKPVSVDFYRDCDR